MSLFGRLVVMRAMVQSPLLGVSSCIAVVGGALVPYGIAVADVAIGDLKGVTTAGLITGGNGFFLGVGRDLGPGFSFGLKISGPSLFRVVTTAFHALLA